MEVLGGKIAAAHSGWSEISFCLTQDGFHSEIFRGPVQNQNGEARREEGVGGLKEKEHCKEWIASE